MPSKYVRALISSSLLPLLSPSGKILPRRKIWGKLGLRKKLKVRLRSKGKPVSSLKCWTVTQRSKHLQSSPWKATSATLFCLIQHYGANPGWKQQLQLFFFFFFLVKITTSDRRSGGLWKARSALWLLHSVTLCWPSKEPWATRLCHQEPAPREPLGRIFPRHVSWPRLNNLGIRPIVSVRSMSF